jgi:hypothetical protein
MAPQTVDRVSEFIAGATIRSINAEEFSYSAIADPSAMGSLSEAKIKEIDTEGRLIVQFNDGPELVVMQPWLVEVVDS